jgi:hypothetical protein
VPTTREVAGDGSVVLCPAGDAAAYAREVAALIGDPAHGHAMRRRAIRHARTRGWAPIFNDLIADYQDVACMRAAFASR